MENQTEVTQKKRLLIMGIGNYLMGDEGLGSHFVNRFAKEIPDEIDILDGGTGGFHLMVFFENYQNVILIDAVLDDTEPGTIKLLKPQFSKDFPKAMSTHDIGLKDLVESMNILGSLPKIYLFTISINKIQPMEVSLSPEIDNSLYLLKKKILDLAETIL